MLVRRTCATEPCDEIRVRVGVRVGVWVGELWLWLGLGLGLGSVVRVRVSLVMRSELGLGSNEIGKVLAAEYTEIKEEVDEEAEGALSELRFRVSV